MLGSRRSPIKFGSEDDLHIQVCEYLKFKYPNVLFRTDFAAGTKLSMSQAVRNKRMQSCRAWPDLFIAEGQPWGAHDKFGLFLELKKEGTKLYLKDGETMVANPHYREQETTLELLRGKGYQAMFAVGFDEAKKIIDDYLS